MTFARAQFADFFSAVRLGQQPFAWQERLLDHLLSEGRWPDRIVAPTGAGKTAVVDVHVFANALVAAGVVSVRLPRRLGLVVDRRVVVDSHHDHAESIAALLRAAGPGLLRDMADALRSWWLAPLQDPTEAIPIPDESLAPLRTTRLRGGSPPPRGWRDYPEACTVISATPDMLGSRLLLQGYGSSRLAWPREAGLLAFDTVIVVDEAHLARQFLTTARRVGQLAATEAGSRLCGEVPTVQIVETTATPVAGGDMVDVGVVVDDLADPLLAGRLTADKPVALVSVPTIPVASGGKSLATIVEEVVAVRKEFGPTVGCVVNRVATAVAVTMALRARGCTVEMLVGRMRPADVTDLRRRRPGVLSVGGNAEVDVLVATQTIEVGVDLDLSALVTELAPGAALAQRCGRVNRLGRRAGTRVVVAVPEGGEVPKKGTQPYEREELVDSLAWLQRRSETTAGMAPWSLGPDPAPEQSMRRTALRRLEVADSWLFAGTGDDPADRPDLDLWLSDDLAADREAGVVVRAGLTSDPVLALSLVRRMPPRAHEVFPGPVHLVRELIDLLKDEMVPMLRVRGDEVTVVGATETDVDVRVGDVVVVGEGAAIQQAGVLSTDANRRVSFDVLERIPEPGLGAASVPVGTAVLRWGGLEAPDDDTRTASIANWGPLPSAARLLLSEGATGPRADWSREQRTRLADILSASTLRAADAGSKAHHEGMRDAVVALLRAGRVSHSSVQVWNGPDGNPVLCLITDVRQATADEDLRQTWSPTSTAVPLTRHADAVAAASGRLAARLGLGPLAVEAMKKAGLHHDDGKSDDRFQRLLGRDGDDPPLAKSGRRSPAADAAARAASGLPRGWRHEQLSVVLTDPAELGDPPDLALRLIGTSHGHGRRSFPHGTSGLLGADCSAEARARAGWLFDEGGWESMIERTEEEFGVWAVAYLESLLRAADGRVSRAGS